LVKKQTKRTAEGVAFPKLGSGRKVIKHDEKGCGTRTNA